MYKTTMLLGLLVAIMSVSAFGAGIIGTPTAELEQGQWNVGFNYMYSDMELDKTKMKVSGSEIIKYKAESGDSHTDKYSGTDSFKFESDDVKTQRYYGAIGYGLTDSWEVYVQLGIADLKAKVRDEGESEWNGLNFDNDFAWGWGTRYTFYEQDNVRWGASVQMNWLDTSWDEKSMDDEVAYVSVPDVGMELFLGEEHEKTQLDWSSYDLLIAVGPTVDMGGWNLYGGPFYYLQKGDLDLTTTETGVSYSSDLLGYDVITRTRTETMKSSGDLEADSIGCFVGAQCTLMEKFSMTTELAFTGDGWAIGAGVIVPF